MLSGIANYLFGASEEDAESQTKDLEPRLQTRYAENCDWVIVEQSSRGRSQERVEASPMENLLIEHPSMSVYGTRGRNTSTGVASDLSESSSDSDTGAGVPGEEMEVAVAAPPAARVVHHCAAPRRPQAVAQRAGLVAAQVQSLRAVQREKQRRERRQASRNHLQRANRVHDTQSRNKHQRRKDFMLRPSGRSNDRRC